jgi:hypothetical protein
VTWKDETPQDRAARKQRRGQRRTRRERLTVKLWAERDVQARSPEDRAKLYHDLVLRQIKNIKGSGARDEAYRDLTKELRSFARTLPGADKILALLSDSGRE